MRMTKLTVTALVPDDDYEDLSEKLDDLLNRYGIEYEWDEITIHKLGLHPVTKESVE